MDHRTQLLSDSHGRLLRGNTLIWRQDCARTRQLALSPFFSRARMEEKSREFAEKGNEIYAKA